MNKTNVAQQAKTASFLPHAQGMFQRKCACGNHKMAKGECEECGKNKQGLQRASLDSASRSFMKPHHGHGISRMPTHHNEPNTIQSKLTISEPGDKYEQEADRVAASVMSSQPANDGPKALATNNSSNTSRARSNLDKDTKSFMETRFSTNFDQVRVHTDHQASKASVALGARAFAMGPDIYFASGEYQPHTSSGRLLLAHELTHVVQQGHAAPMVQRMEAGISSDLTNEASAIPSSNNIGSVVDEADRGTQSAIKSLERALNEADASLAEKRFDDEKLARIRVQANKLRPMLEAYRKVERGEQPAAGLTLDFDPKRDQIDEGDADLLASGELMDSGSVSTAAPQVFASRAEHGLVSLRVQGVDAQRAVCGGLCIAGAIALGALLFSGCSGKKKPKQPKLKMTTVRPVTTGNCGLYDFAVKWSIDNATSSTQGWVVQHVTSPFNIKGCNNVAKTDAEVKALSGGWDPANYPFYEAWQVRNGQVYVGSSVQPHSADSHSWPGTGDGTKGSKTFTGHVDFYQNLTLPKSYTVRNKSPAWSLPYSKAAGNLTGGTGPQQYSLIATWFCCPKADGTTDKTTTFKTTNV